ncbi:MAG: DUF3365 domain-containing protein [Planctomycetes bacterium]|nr:DUF3365 domain-containing protein [Planctomycetota bacterium]
MSASQKYFRRWFAWGTLMLVAGAAFLGAWPALSEAEPAPTSEENRELDRARREIRLLDDIYKTAIVLITKHYVKEDSDLAAGEAFKALFAGVKEKGWHEVRLLDATGESLNEANKPQDDFEKNAIKALLAGKTFYEEQSQENGKRYLRAATPIPIALEKCKMCHSNYREQKVIGALGYKLPLESNNAAR